MKDSIRTKFITPHNNLHKLYDFVASEVRNRTFYFNRKQPTEVNKYLEPITKQEILDLIDLVFKKNIEVLVVSKTHQKDYQLNKPAVYTIE